YLAIGLELQRRGHQPVIATHAIYRARVEAMGLDFAPVRPNGENWGEPAGVIREAMDARRGSEVVLKQLVLPYLRESRDDLLVASRGADLIVDHVLAFPAPLVAESLKLPRVSTALQPFAMFSRFDPPRTPNAPFLHALQGLGPVAWRVLWWLAAASTRPLFRPLEGLRREMSLPASRRHPMLDGASPDLHLAL